jgi:hypothetical protein
MGVKRGSEVTLDSTVVDIDSTTSDNVIHTESDIEDRTVDNVDRPAIAGHFPWSPPFVEPVPSRMPDPKIWYRPGRRNASFEYVRRPLRKVIRVEPIKPRGHEFFLECGHSKKAATVPKRIRGFKCDVCRDEFIAKLKKEASP